MRGGYLPVTIKNALLPGAERAVFIVDRLLAGLPGLGRKPGQLILNWNSLRADYTPATGSG